jgi:hypothetical protein
LGSPADIVWEYVSPYLGPVAPANNVPGNWVYRAVPVP